MNKENIIYVDNKPHIKCGVIMLPTTDKTGTIWMNNQKQLIHTHVSGEYKEKYTPYNLYITSNEKIKEGDWCLIDNNVGQSKGYLVLKCKKTDTSSGWYYFEGFKTGRCKKIIATTDNSLVVENNTETIVENGGFKYEHPVFKSLPKPSKQFIEKWVEEYNKSNIVTEALIEAELLKPLKGDKVFIGGKERIVTEGAVFSTNFDGYYFYTSFNDAWRCEEYRLKLDSQNQITIRKQKNSWSREELPIDAMITLRNSLNTPIFKRKFIGSVMSDALKEMDNWIEENL